MILFPKCTENNISEYKNLMSYCSGLTTCVFLISVLSVNRLSYLYLRSIFSHSCVRFKYQFYKHNVVFTFLYLLLYFQPFMFQHPTSTVPMYSYTFPTGLIFITVGERKVFFTLFFHNCHIITNPFQYSSKNRLLSLT
jgi:hypothetical protein